MREMNGSDGEILGFEYDLIEVRPIKAVGDRIRAAAEKSGKSPQDYLLDAADAQIAAEEEGEEISSSVLLNLMDWLKKQGCSAEEIVDCLSYLAAGREDTEETA